MYIFLGAFWSLIYALPVLELSSEILVLKKMILRLFGFFLILCMLVLKGYLRCPELMLLLEIAIAARSAAHRLGAVLVRSLSTAHRIGAVLVRSLVKVMSSLNAESFFL